MNNPEKHETIEAYAVLSIADLKSMIERIKADNSRLNLPVSDKSCGLFHACVIKLDGDWQISSVDLVYRKG